MPQTGSWRTAWQDKPIVAQSGIGTFLQRPVYVLQCACVEPFFLFKRGSEDTGFHVADLVRAAALQGRSHLHLHRQRSAHHLRSWMELQADGLAVQAARRVRWC